MGRSSRVVARVGVAALCAVTIAAGVAAPALAAKQPTPAAAKKFLAQLEQALQEGDAAFLLAHLDKAVIDRYGKAACRTYTTTLKDPTRKLTPTNVTGPDDFDYTTDGLTTTVPKVFAIDVDAVQDGNPSSVTVHVKTNKWFTDCGDLGPKAIAAAVIAAAKQYAGHFTGSWKNTTFGSTGDSDMTLTVNGKNGTLKLRGKLTGNVFGAPAPAPETLEAELDLTKIGAPVVVTSKTFGEVTTTLQPDGSLVIDAPDVPGANVNTFHMEAKLVGDGIEGTYTVGLASGATANGTVTLTKA